MWKKNFKESIITHGLNQFIDLLFIPIHLLYTDEILIKEIKKGIFRIHTIKTSLNMHYDIQTFSHISLQMVS